MLTSFGNRYHRGVSYGGHSKGFGDTSTVDILIDTINGDLKFIIDGEDRGPFATNTLDLKSGEKLYITHCSAHSVAWRFVNPA
jgi:hypothetical protein